ncbi:MAG: hypothetical protein QNJ45_01965 [Ardenticatenaceae bacterium]|nr:hypothetical protein [Ardenticatenaceae bacterium]
MNDSQNRQIFQLSVIVILSIYALAFNQAQLNPSRWFPQFDLTFASDQPESGSHYDLRFISINGQTFPAPLYFSEAENWIADEQIYDGQQVINRLGIAVYREDTARIQALSRILEEDFFGSIDAAEYQIVFRVINPVEKYHLQGNYSEEIIGNYTYTRTPHFLD